MAVTTTTALILGGAALGAGVGAASGVMGMRDAKRQAIGIGEQASFAVSERLRQAVKMEQNQAVSYLKSGVTLEGTPEAVMAETREFAAEDARQIFKESDIQQANLKRLAKTQMFSSVLKGMGQGAMAGAKFGLPQTNMRSL